MADRAAAACDQNPTPAVCEGCATARCSSNCILGRAAGDRTRRKARHQSSTCNKDYSAGRFFCPSFVTVRGKLKSRAPAEIARLARLPDPGLTSPALWPVPKTSSRSASSASRRAHHRACSAWPPYRRARPRVILDISGRGRKGWRGAEPCGGGCPNHSAPTSNLFRINRHRQFGRSRGSRSRRSRRARLKDIHHRLWRFRPQSRRHQSSTT